MPHDHLVEGAQEQLAGLRGAHPHLQAVARGIVEEEQRHSAQTRRAGAQMLAVGEHALDMTQRNRYGRIVERINVTDGSSG